MTPSNVLALRVVCCWGLILLADVVCIYVDMGFLEDAIYGWLNAQI